MVHARVGVKQNRLCARREFLWGASIPSSIGCTPNHHHKTTPTNSPRRIACNVPGKACATRHVHTHTHIPAEETPTVCRSADVFAIGLRVPAQRREHYLFRGDSGVVVAVVVVAETVQLLRRLCAETASTYFMHTMFAGVFRVTTFRC